MRPLSWSLLAAQRLELGLEPQARSPFLHELRFTPLQKAKIAFMTFTLFPIRLIIAAFMMLLVWPFAFVASIGRTEKDLEKSLSWWRWILDILIKVILRAMWFACGFHWITVKGRQALPAEAPILILAPHSSFFDAIPVTMSMSSVVIKEESRSVPLWGTIINYIQPVFVSRSDQDSRRKTVEEIKRRAHSNGIWPQVMIFPEGTCTNRSCLITFKPGAFIPGVPVQPLVLRYPNTMDTVTWTWQGPGVLNILWLTFCQFHNFVEIEFLPIYIPSEEEKKNPTLYANNVRCLMAKALGIPVTDFTFEDCQLALAKGQLPLPSSTSLLEFAKLMRSLGLNPKKLGKHLDKYSESAKKRRGERITLREFASYINVPASESLEHLFALFNKMYQSEQDRTIVQEDLACILKTALGVSDLNVSDLFGAVDEQKKRQITYADFYKFVKLHPDFAEEYLFPIQKEFRSYLTTSSFPTTNGLCTDFSPVVVKDNENFLQKKWN
uniref:Lysophosphatidylcholine acyltransferase 1 isoform X2 n=1 Tax=Geotrypetes seraphini TaxID=260995 RepID=A0A6P8P8G9_GEOSA|nr:lysophosphatidylcholine acyltransferase 1 isoform X2 [Geotrypetes seraphini]